MGRTTDRSTEEYIHELQDSRAKGITDVVFTGGEPTIRKDILYLLEYAEKLGFNINMQTNGRGFYYKEYAKKFIPFNITYVIALHGNNAEVHESITRSTGSFHQTVTGIKNLKELGAHNLIGKTVISCLNYQHLPAIALMLIKSGVIGMNFAFPHANGNALKYFEDVVPHYSDIMNYVYDTIKVVKNINSKKNTNIALEFEAIPFCLMVGYEQFVAELHFINADYAELKQLNMPGGKDWNKLRRAIKLKFSQCRKCKYDTICEGVWEEYPKKRGSSEFNPVT
jgi:cyclic pyranopterin phosphate synthase